MKTLKIITSVVLMVFGLHCSAEKYQIKALNTPTISIDNKKAKVGDWFTDKSVIIWNNENQAMRVVSDDNKVYTLSAKTYKDSKAKKFSDFIAYPKPLATRGPSDNTVLAQLKDRFDNVFIMLDEIFIDLSDLELLDNDYFCVTFKDSQTQEDSSFKVYLKDKVFLINRKDLYLRENEEGTMSLEITFFPSSGSSSLITDAFEIEVLPVLNAKAKCALLIGISDYGNAMEDPNKWANISGANDVMLLSPLLAEQGYSVTSLVDSQATHAGITDALAELAKESKKGDTVYIHFSMHGQPFEDLNGDEEDGWDEALIPVDAEMYYSEGVYEGNNHLLDDELEVYFDELRSKLGQSGNLYVILDACHSGTSSRGFDDHIRGTREGFTRSGLDYYPDRTRETNDYFTVSSKEGQSPVTFIEACRSYQLNNEVRDADTNTWYGSLSYYIAKAMNDNKTVGSDEWIDAIKTGMATNRKLRKQNVVIEKSE